MHHRIGLGFVLLVCLTGWVGRGLFIRFVYSGCGYGVVGVKFIVLPFTSTYLSTALAGCCGIVLKSGFGASVFSVTELDEEWRKTLAICFS